MANFFKLILIVATLLAVASCANKISATKYYVLSPVATATDNLNDSLSIAVGPVIIPERLKTATILEKVSAHEVKHHENKRWAEPLQDNIITVIASNLSHILKVQAWPYNVIKRRGVDYQIKINIVEFQPNVDNYVVLQANWQLVDVGSNHIVARKQRVYTAEVTTTEFDGKIVALNATLFNLAADIAKDIKP